jgi:hypothetical protein
MCIGFEPARCPMFCTYILDWRFSWNKENGIGKESKSLKLEMRELDKEIGKRVERFEHQIRA